MFKFIKAQVFLLDSMTLCGHINTSSTLTYQDSEAQEGASRRSSGVAPYEAADPGGGARQAQGAERDAGAPAEGVRREGQDEGGPGGQVAPAAAQAGAG